MRARRSSIKPDAFDLALGDALIAPVVELGRPGVGVGGNPLGSFVRHVLEEGDVIETYPGDEPYPSYLMLGRDAGGRPIHVVAADNGKEEETIVVTIYEPDPERWTDDFRTRISKDDE